MGSLEIAAKLGAKLIVVKGHSSCGAIGLAMAKEHRHSIGTITRKIEKAIMQCGCTQHHIDTKDAAMIERIAKQNVQNSLAEILSSSPYLRERMERGEIGLIGAYHGIVSSHVTFGDMVQAARPRALALT